MVVGKGKDSPEESPIQGSDAYIHDSNASEESQTEVDQGLKT